MGIGWSSVVPFTPERTPEPVRAAIGIALAGLLVASTGCTPREERIRVAMESAQARMEEAHRILRNAPGVIPASGEAGMGCVTEGLPRVDADLRATARNVGNLDIMMIADVKRPWDESKARHPMARSVRLGPAMGWLLGGVPIGDKAPASYVERVLQGAMSIRYVLLFKVTEYKAPKALSVKTYTGGTIAGEFIVVDLDESKVVCILPCVGKNDETMFYFRGQGMDEAGRVAKFQEVLVENLYASARRDAYRRLQVLIPGSQVLSY